MFFGPIVNFNQTLHSSSKKSSTLPLREKGPNTEFFLVRIFLYSEQKKLHIWTLNAVLHHILLIMGLLEVSFKFIPEFYDLMIK